MTNQNKKFFLVLFGATCQVYLFIKTFCLWALLGIQPDNMTVMLILLLTILLERKYKHLNS